MSAVSDYARQDPDQGEANRWQLLSWAAYDWANSSFATVIQTFVFAAYFTRQIAASEEQGQSQWAFAGGCAGVAVALSGPLLGAIADQTGRRKPWIAVLTAIGVVATACLWFVTPDATVWMALIPVVIAAFGVEGAFIFYNAMLPSLAGPSRVGRWSGWAWALGYLGGLVCLVVALFALVGQPPGNGLITSDEARNVRASFLLVAGWLALFSMPLFLFTPDAVGTGKGMAAAVSDGLRQLVDSIRHVRRYAHIVRFLIARLFYIDGLTSIFAMGGVYAAGVFGMEMDQIIMFGITLNVTAGLGSFCFSWVDDHIGSKTTIVLSLLGIMVPGVAMLIVESAQAFWICGLTLGLFVGPVQAASRTFMARAAPPELRTQAFGLYALSGKATAFVVPYLVSAVTIWTHSQRLGMVPIFVFLGIGLVILLTVPQASQVDDAEE
jgi:UMF1 family MFS transporter